VQYRPDIALRGGNGRFVQPGTGAPTGWPRAFRSTSAFIAQGEHSPRTDVNSIEPRIVSTVSSRRRSRRKSRSTRVCWSRSTLIPPTGC
jgi:hypothetical protein